MKCESSFRVQLAVYDYDAYADGYSEDTSILFRYTLFTVTQIAVFQWSRHEIERGLLSITMQMSTEYFQNINLQFISSHNMEFVNLIDMGTFYL